MDIYLLNTCDDWRTVESMRLAGVFDNDEDLVRVAKEIRQEQVAHGTHDYDNEDEITFDGLINQHHQNLHVERIDDDEINTRL